MITINGAEVILDKFPNGETKIELKELVKESIHKYEIKWKYESDADFMTLRFITDYIWDVERAGKSVFTTDIHILYMPYSRMDRSEGGSVYTLKSAVDILTLMWVDNWYVYEPHSEVTGIQFGVEEADTWYHEVNLTDDLLEKAIEERMNKAVPYVIFYPDKGAKARYDKGDHFYLTGAKTRDFETGKITSYEIEDASKIKKGSPFEVIIVDDLCSYGGTFVEASKKLIELGATDITLVVAHAEDSIQYGSLFQYVNKVYTTNSIIDASNGWEQRAPLGLTSYPIYIKEII